VRLTFLGGGGVIYAAGFGGTAGPASSADSPWYVDVGVKDPVGENIGDRGRVGLYVVHSTGLAVRGQARGGDDVLGLDGL
jgi:hypothetical protein